MQALPDAGSAELWHAALELEPSGVAVLDGADLRVRFANAAFKAAIPTPHRDPVGRPVEDVWPGEVGRRVRGLGERVLATGEPALHERYAHAAEDGVRRVFAFHLKRLPEPGGASLLVVVWDTSDVEEARRAAERARERAELLAALAGELSAGAELEAVFRTALARATSLLGASDGVLWVVDGERLRGLLELRPLGRRGELLELARHPHALRAARLLVPVLFARGEAEADEDALCAREEAGAVLLAPVVESGRCTGLLQLVYREGSTWPRPADVDFAEAIASHCALAAARARIFESERQARARAEAAEAEARRVGELQERLAAVVSHDLRTPLAVVRLTVDTLLRRAAADAPATRALARIASSSARMEAIIRDLLDFARARSGSGMPVTLAPVRLDDVARQAVGELEAATGRRVRLDVAGDTGLLGDASRLGQIVSNLVGNALDHDVDEGVDVRIDGTGEALRLEVHNGGAAVAPELLPRMFEPFHRGPHPRAEDTRSGHLGLGLFIVAEIARAHGGAVRVRSTAEEGTTFTVTLPRGPR